MRTLIFDTETTGFPKKDLDPWHPEQASIVQLAMQVYDDRRLMNEFCFIVSPEYGPRNKEYVPEDVSKIHGITTEDVKVFGVGADEILDVIIRFAFKCERVVCHNASFDLQMLDLMFSGNLCHVKEYQKKFFSDFKKKPSICTMKSATPVMKLPGKYGYKWPKLEEAYKFFVDEKGFDGAHNAMNDVKATAAVLWALEDQGVELVHV